LVTKAVTIPIAPAVLVRSPRLPALIASMSTAQPRSARRARPVLPCAAIGTQRALTLVELLLAIAILGVLGTLAYAGYQQYFDKARIAQAKTDIREIESALERYRVGSGRYPETLAEAGLARLDPWKHPYEYLNIATAKNRGQVRKDRNLVPINSDYDLYSMGKDGLSKPPLTAKPSQDDVIRANDGAFVGLGSDY
jgi:general secretion pathway protein G